MDTPPTDTPRVSAPDRADGPDDIASRVDVARHVLSRVPGARSPIVLFDRDALTRQVESWRAHLGAVDPHFAVKSCNASAVLRHFHALGLSFDAATAGEIRLLEDLGVPPERVICTHPIRDDEDLRAIARYRPRALVVENAAELRKLARAGIPDAGYAPELFVRVELPFGGLSGKFGVEVAVLDAGDGGEAGWHVTSAPVRRILRAAKAIEEKTGARFGGFGLSSHVGTNTTSADKYDVMLRVFGHLADRLAEHGFEVSVFNLGGGYCDPEKPREDGTTQERFLAELGAVVRAHAERRPGVRFIAEPGRFMVSDAGTVVIGVMHVEERRLLLQPDGALQEVPHLKVQMNDGLYGNLLGERHDEKSWRLVPFRGAGAAQPLSEELLPAVLNGKTCDSWDRLARMRPLPRDLAAGDHLLVPNAGAYTLVTATDFNSAPRSQVCLHWREPDGAIGTRLHDARGGDVDPVDRPSWSPSMSSSLSITSAVSLGGVSMVSLSGLARGVDLGGDLVQPAPPSDGRWQEPLSLVYTNDATLRVDELVPVDASDAAWTFRVRREGRAGTFLLRIGRVPPAEAGAAAFRAEVTAIARVAVFDPRVPAVEESGVLPEGGHAYVFEAAASGPTLAELDPPPGGTAADWRRDARRAGLERVMRAALAVAAGHAAGCAHGDVRPENIVVPFGAEDTVVVGRWGRLGAGSSAPADDVRGLGETLRHVASGAAAGPRLPAELESIVDKATGAGWRAPYADAAGFAEDLRRFLAGEVVAAHREALSPPAALVYVARRAMRRRGGDQGSA